MTLPSTLRAGDTWSWTHAGGDTPAPTWTLKVRARHPSLAGLEAAATASGSDHRVTVAAADSNLGAGEWTFVAWAENGSVVQTLTTWPVRVLPNVRAGTAAGTLDTRTTARKILDGLEAALAEHTAGNPLRASYSIEGRSMQFVTLADLDDAITHWRGIVNAEERRAAIARGEPVRPSRLPIGYTR